MPFSTHQRTPGETRSLTRSALALEILSPGFTPAAFCPLGTTGSATAPLTGAVCFGRRPPPSPSRLSSWAAARVARPPASRTETNIRKKECIACAYARRGKASRGCMAAMLPCRHRVGNAQGAGEAGLFRRFRRPGRPGISRFGNTFQRTYRSFKGFARGLFTVGGQMPRLSGKDRSGQGARFPPKRLARQPFARSAPRSAGPGTRIATYRTRRKTAGLDEGMGAPSESAAGLATEDPRRRGFVVG